ncbi:Protein lunapark-B [Blattella germanica]|nr:Protein lunapark-B [Blattella germanica]
MGVFLSRFKKKKTTLEVLEGLENKIKSIEENRINTEQRQRKIVGHLILYSVGAYILAAFVFYFLYFPANLQDQLFYITPLLIFPIIVVLLKRLVTWYYRRKLTRSQEKLHDMREEKKKLLDDVMDKETYKVAKEILEKFAPEQLRKTSSMVLPVKPTASHDLSVHRRATTTIVPASTTSLTLPTIAGAGPSPETDLRRRSVGNPPGPVGAPSAAAGMPLGQGRTPTPREAFLYGTPAGHTNGQGPPGPPMPRPILPRDRSYLDKLVEYLVGDGPSNRYALICRQCESHNGMALKEEFEYVGFRCCYCFFWNPARKQRPQAPRLPSASSGTSSLQGHTSASELESASDSEEESGSDQLSEPDSREASTEDLTEPSEATPLSTEPVGKNEERPLTTASEPTES